MYTLETMVTVEQAPVKASDRAYAALLDEIQSGALPAGAVVAEAEQAARLSVSRTPMREALRRLAADGLIVQQSPRVTVVAGIDKDDIRALFEIRRALEESAARLAAERGDTAVFQSIADQLATVHLDRDSDRDLYYDLIGRLDRAIDEAIANDYIASALRTARAHLVRVRRMARDRPERLSASVAEHRSIAQAIADRDGALASHATHVHLHNALASILQNLDIEG